MINKRLGISAWITDSRDKLLPEYQVEYIDDETMECWIPSTEGTNFEIKWTLLGEPQPGLDLGIRPFLDGIGMNGTAQLTSHLVEKPVGRLYQQRTGASSARLYQFGKRVLTDKDDGINLTGATLNELNTIRVELQWGHCGIAVPATAFTNPKDIGPIHEKAAKKGHAGSAELGKSVVVPKTCGAVFTPEPSMRRRSFIFHYGSEDWLRAREIIPCTPCPNSPKTQKSQKRARSTTPETIDIDELETDDEDIVIIKHMIPAPVAPVKKRRIVKKEEDIKPKLETVQ
ncbi:hypothetical protein CTheo_3568 [Ceratobasidium theobromae]|uniref:DUF7918 domain-containing protein n=1 Tax=Ceratobasidium theobromae TaxID=1582974 RepID=A0A5N5QMU7_9AGAM|nr:hypothetical protein CTheo_3568 [Ceratobasidium theobromae]